MFANWKVKSFVNKTNRCHVSLGRIVNTRSQDEDRQAYRNTFNIIAGKAGYGAEAGGNVWSVQKDDQKAK